MTVVKEIIDTPPLFVDKTIKIFSMQSNETTYLLNYSLFNFLSLISRLK